MEFEIGQIRGEYLYFCNNLQLGILDVMNRKFLSGDYNGHCDRIERSAIMGEYYGK